MGGYLLTYWCTGAQDSLANFIAIHNAVSNQSSIYAHLNGCGYFTPNVAYAATQGQGIELASDSGRADGIHLHFHVINGSEYLGPHTTVPFSVSDRDSFTGTGSNGPSDNAGVAYSDPGSLDANIRNVYLAQGGDSASWWNMGSPWKTLGGPCAFVDQPWVHTCTSAHGTWRLQNYLSYTGAPRAIARNASGSASYVIRDTTWRALAGLYRQTNIVSNVLGPPTGSESTIGDFIRHNFANGKIERYTDRVRQVFVGGVWKATYYFQTTVPGECFDVERSGDVDMSDVLEVLDHFGEVEPGPPWDPRYDVTHDGWTDLGDAGRVNQQFGMECSI